jgi:hypothetical protein
MPPRNYKSITVPTFSYDAALKARADLLQRGLASVPDDVLEPKACPHCQGVVDHVTVGIEHIKCRSCGYAQQTVDVSGSTLGQVGLGVVIGLGLAALFKAISEADERPAKRLPTARTAKKSAAKRRKPSR